MKHLNLFDIETKPDPLAVSRFTDPFPDFNEADVKCGNIKDPVKIAEKIAAEKAKHEAERLAYWAKANDEAALNPFTGSVLCIGVMDAETAQTVMLYDPDERATLNAFWSMFASNQHAVTRWAFWSGNGNSDENFDVDFLVTRSRILDVRVPTTVIQSTNRRFYSERFVDLAKVFLLHRRNAYCSLTKAAEVCGLYERHHQLRRKSDQDTVQGHNFHLWWDGKGSDTLPAADQRTMALAYLTNDLEHLRVIAPRLF